MSREASDFKMAVPWGHVSGKWWGPLDKPPVICLHGWQDNAGTFDTLAPLLPEQLALLCLDMPGHGFSSPLHQGQFYYHWWDSLTVLRRIVKHLNLERVSLMGHSRGGSVVFLYAATYPDQVDKIVCIDSAFPKLITPQEVVDGTKSNIDKFLEYDTKLSTDVRSYDKQSMLEIVEDAYGGSVSRKGCEILMRRGMSENPARPNTYYFTRDPRVKLSGLGALSKDLVLAYAQKITCEYLNVRFDQGTKSAYAEMYDDVLEIIEKNAKSFKYHKVPGTHHQHLNDPSQIADIIGSFLTTSLNVITESERI